MKIWRRMKKDKRTIEEALADIHAKKLKRAREEDAADEQTPIDQP